MSLCFLQAAEDEGQYRCTARNERGEVSLAMSLDVKTDIIVGMLRGRRGRDMRT